MKTSLFQYVLPSHLIAQTPLHIRNQSRLLICKKNQRTIEDRAFYEIPEELEKIFSLKARNAKLLLIANDSCVYPARVNIQRATGAQGEVFFLETGHLKEYHCLLRPQNKIKKNELLYAAQDSSIPLFQVTNFNPTRVLLKNNLSLDFILEKYGRMPVPPYIHRKSTQDSEFSDLDKQRYQTVYANRNAAGSCAAPTAGLHLSEEMIKNFHHHSVEMTSVTLHVGLGTFLPVQSQTIENHQIHKEHYFIPKLTAEKILLFLEKKWPILFVGTTSLRAVESFFQKAFPDKESFFNTELKNQKNISETLIQNTEKWLSTNIFIHPKNRNDAFVPYIGNGLITNFHQPGSTLVMLVAALMGFDFWKQFYHHALSQQYRFLSYGDSNLLIFKENQL